MKNTIYVLNVDKLKFVFLQINLPVKINTLQYLLM